MAGTRLLWSSSNLTDHWSSVVEVHRQLGFGQRLVGLPQLNMSAGRSAGQSGAWSKENFALTQSCKSLPA